MWWVFVVTVFTTVFAATVNKNMNDDTYICHHIESCKECRDKINNKDRLINDLWRLLRDKLSTITRKQLEARIKAEGIEI